MVDERTLRRTKRFQIRSGSFGVSLYERETAREALLDFVIDRSRAEFRRSITVDDGGVASVTLDGETFTTRELPPDQV